MATLTKNTQVSGQSKYRRAAPIFHSEDHKMHMIIVALDYKQTGRPLTSTVAARNVEELARGCRVQWISALYEEECTRPAVVAAVKQMVEKCGPDDVFIFYFAGHGAEAKGSSQTQEPGPGAVNGHAFVLIDKSGHVTESTLLASDELAKMITDNCPQQTRIIFLIDTCYHTTIVDLDRGDWDSRQALVIAGTQHPRCEQDDNGGIFTHNILLAIDKLSKVGRENYSAGMLFNAALYEDELVFSGKQDMLLQSAPGFSPDALAWPFVPQPGYQAPLSRCAGPGGIRSDASRLGVSPSLLQHVRQEALNQPVSIEEYVQQVQGQSLFGIKPCRACSAGCTGAGDGCILQ